MEKLSKLTTNNPLKLNDFNFSGFSRSKNWIGYFERINSYSFELVDEAIEMFDTFFKNEQDNVLVMTALNYDELDESYDKDEVMKKYRPIHNKFRLMGILQEFNKDFENYVFEDAKLSANCLRFDFLKWSDIIELSELMMSYSCSMREACFFIFINLNLAVYPHGDTGFGCIGLNDKKENGIKFLEYCKKNKNFKIAIE
ncbi:MAG: hypothetical protein LBH46_01045 [Rickettsiales bacterium]|jgi:hypothetical protein|nr:hypothetical protein [Rickettsiales bacterium]